MVYVRVWVTARPFLSYGVGYSTSEEGSAFHVMSYGLGTAEFCRNAERGLEDIKRLMEAGPGKSEE